MSRKNGSPNYLQFGPEEIIVIPQEDRGKLAENDYGPYFLRHWQDGRFSCMSEDAERRLLDCGIRAGVPVGITKMQYGKSAIWKVRVIDGAKPQPVKANGHTNGHATPAEVTWANLPSEKYSQSPADAQLEEKLRESIAAVQVAKAAPATDDGLNLMARCGCAAVDAAIAVTAYAAGKGLPLKFNESSIQSWASTMFINASSRPRSTD